MSSHINNFNSFEFINKEKIDSSIPLVNNLNSKMNTKMIKTPETMDEKSRLKSTTFNSQKQSTNYNLELSNFFQSLSMNKDKINKNYNNILYKKYLNTKNKYNKFEQITSDLDNLNKKIDINNKKIEKITENLKKIKEEKKQKQSDIVNLLSNKESLEEIYKNKILYLITNKGKKLNSIETIQNNDKDNIKIINENESYKIEEEKELEITVDDVKKSDKKKFIEQVINFTEEIFQKKEEEFNNEIINKINIVYKIFFSEISTTRIKPDFIISNFFSRLSLYISNHSLGNYSELNINKFLRYLLKINSIGVEIFHIIKFLNKIYKDIKKELKEQLINLNKKKENYTEKKKILEKNKKKMDINKEYFENFNKSNDEIINKTLDDFYFSNNLSNFKLKNKENIFNKKEYCSTYRRSRRKNNIVDNQNKNRNYLYYFNNCNIINNKDNVNENNSYDFSRNFIRKKINTNNCLDFNEFNINNLTVNNKNNNKINERNHILTMTNINDDDKIDIFNKKNKFGINRIKIKKINMAKLSRIRINNNDIDIEYNSNEFRKNKINSKLNNNKGNNNINESLNDFKNINNNHNNTINVNNFIINNDIKIKNINDLTNNNNDELNNINVDNNLNILNSYRTNNNLKLNPINTKIYYSNSKDNNNKIYYSNSKDNNNKIYYSNSKDNNNRIKKNNTCGFNNKGFKKITINNIRYLKSNKNKNKVNDKEGNLIDENNAYLENDKNIELNRKSIDLKNHIFNKNIYLINNINNSQKLNTNQTYNITMGKNNSNNIVDKKTIRNAKFRTFNEEFKYYNKTEEKYDEENINNIPISDNKSYNKNSDIKKSDGLLNNINFKNIKFKNTNQDKKIFTKINTNKNILQANSMISKNIINNTDHNNFNKIPHEKKVPNENEINNHKLKTNNNVNNNVYIISKDKIKINNKQYYLIKSKKKKQ